MEKFDYSKYPGYVNINVNRGEYAWKPIIIHQVCERYGGCVVWLDSGCLINKTTLTSLYDLLQQTFIWTPPSSGTIKKWTHPKTIEYLQYRGSLNLIPRSGGVVGVNYNNVNGKKLITEWKGAALVKECIAPAGSNRNNHRQDQAVLSILYYTYLETLNFKDIWDFYGVNCHRDVGGHS